MEKAPSSSPILPNSCGLPELDGGRGSEVFPAGFGMKADGIVGRRPNSICTAQHGGHSLRIRCNSAGLDAPCLTDRRDLHLSARRYKSSCSNQTATRRQCLRYWP